MSGIRAHTWPPTSVLFSTIASPLYTCVVDSLIYISQRTKWCHSWVLNHAAAFSLLGWRSEPGFIVDIFTVESNMHTHFRATQETLPPSSCPSLPIHNIMSQLAQPRQLPGMAPVLVSVDSDLWTLRTLGVLGLVQGPTHRRPSVFECIMNARAMPWFISVWLYTPGACMGGHYWEGSWVGAEMHPPAMACVHWCPIPLGSEARGGCCNSRQALTVIWQALFSQALAHWRPFWAKPALCVSAWPSEQHPHRSCLQSDCSPSSFHLCSLPAGAGVTGERGGHRTQTCGQGRGCGPPGHTAGRSSPGGTHTPRCPSPRLGTDRACTRCRTCSPARHPGPVGGGPWSPGAHCWCAPHGCSRGNLPAAGPCPGARLRGRWRWGCLQERHQTATWRLALPTLHAHIPALGGGLLGTSLGNLSVEQPTLVLFGFFCT